MPALNEILVVGSGGRVETYDGVTSLAFDDHAGSTPDSISVDSNTVNSLPAVFIGGTGNDTFIYSGSGNATLTGNSGDDYLQGGSGNDVIAGGGGNNTINGGAGNDLITAGDGNNTINGGAGNDTITVGNAARDIIYGGDDNDLITAGNGGNRIYGGYGDDTITSGSGNDFLEGQGGNDVDRRRRRRRPDLRRLHGRPTSLASWPARLRQRRACTAAGSNDYLDGGPGNDYSFLGGAGNGDPCCTAGWEAMCCTVTSHRARRRRSQRPATTC